MTINRKGVLAGLSALGMAAPLSRTFAQAQPIPEQAKTYVLVHGAYGGGWIWRDVAAGLRRQGHQVWTPTQTGLGDRSHLLSREITVDTHVQDVASLIEMED